MDNKINGYEITFISREKMAKYIEDFLNTAEFTHIINCAKTVDDGKLLYCKLGKTLTSYAMATGDLSKDTVIRLISDFDKNKDIFLNNTNFNADLEYFKQYIMPIIKEKMGKKLQIEDIESIKGIIEIRKSC